MSQSLAQGFGASKQPERADRLDRAIARADFNAACRRRALPLLTVLGRSRDSALRALEDAEAHADALRRLRELLTASRARRARSP